LIESHRPNTQTHTHTDDRLLYTATIERSVIIGYDKINYMYIFVCPKDDE